MSSDEVTVDGETYISSKRASKASTYTQDYIGQLARSGQILAKRVGGLWYVSTKSLNTHKVHSGESRFEVTTERDPRSSVESFVALDGKDYISAVRASKISHYNRDYVGQLARNGSVLARQVGNRWYVERESLLKHKHDKDTLLAAVQAQSVGLETKDTDKSDPILQETPQFMKYINEEFDLTPQIDTKRTELYSEAMSAQENPVPVRIRKITTMHSVSRNKRSSPIIKNVYQNVAILGALCTVVVIISFAFTSIRNQSLYTLRTKVEKSSFVAVSGATMSTIGDILEKMITREIFYQRES